MDINISSKEQQDFAIVAVQGGGVLQVIPILFYELQFCKKMKNEVKMGLRGEQGGDEVRCEHDKKCHALAMQSLVSDIVLLCLFQFWN